MNCPVCNSKTQVTAGRRKDGKYERDRECLECLTRFKTKESIEYSSLNDYALTKLHEKVEGGY